VWAHFPLRGAQGGGLLGGSGNGISTAGLYLTLGDAESASQAPKMLPWGASSWSIFFPLVTTKLDKVAGVDYSLVAPPRATANNLDWLLKVRLISRIIHPHAFASEPPHLAASHRPWKQILQ